jgi:hypothetical protein
VANKIDPRVDSDRDNRAGYGTTSTGLGSHNTSTGIGSGLATGTGANAYESTRSSNHGPHGSNIANAADPRVDSDRSNLGSHGSHHQSTGHSTGLGVGAGAAAGAAAGAYGHHESNRSSNHGPHDSNIANKVDPRVDSDRDNSAAYGSHSTSTGLGSSTTATGTGATGTTGLTGHHGTIGDRSQHATHSTATGPASSTAGPHENNLANKADPRVDSDLSKETSGRFDKDVHKGSIGGAGVIPISGNAGPTSTKTFEEAQHTGAAGAGSSYNTAGSGLEHQKTAGPHKSDLANKLDPRVDSDLDGSKTIGGSQRI